MTPLDRARRTLVEEHGMRPPDAALAVAVVLKALANPDDAMRTAGAEELKRALAAGASGSYVRDLAAVVWKAMLFRVDR